MGLRTRHTRSLQGPLWLSLWLHCADAGWAERFLVLPLTFPGGLPGPSGSPVSFNRTDWLPVWAGCLCVTKWKGGERKCQCFLLFKHYLIPFETSNFETRAFYFLLTCLKPITSATEIALLVLDEARHSCQAGGRAGHFSFHIELSSFWVKQWAVPTQQPLLPKVPHLWMAWKNRSVNQGTIKPDNLNLSLKFTSFT